MSEGKHTKYTPFTPVSLQNRQWPNKIIESAPIWCAVDLRDGNQALINPMDHARKIKMFNLLLDMGFKEIEIGFPSASDIEFNFARHIVENNLIPDDVTPQALVQARPHLIERTFEALKGCKRAIIHLYNSTSVAQRRDVFQMDPKGISDLACQGVKLVKEQIAKYPETEWILEYSPESFTGTELEVAADICNAVIEEWDPTPDNKIIINLPSTVEMSTVNIYADQIEWMSNNLIKRDCVTLSVHTHNDRGGGVASTELAVMAGAERVEGTLLGNGERTGNADLITLGLNLLTQGVDPQLSFDDLPKIIETVEECNQIPTHVRHPYAGELVFTALSGSHQDAIKKSLEAHEKEKRNHWDIPYLPLDPKDIGRSYETTIRINSQSGKSGIAYILEKEFGCKLPKAMQIEFSKIVQKFADKTAKEILGEQIWNLFSSEYLEQRKSYILKSCRYENIAGEGEQVECFAALIAPDGEEIEFTGQGNGPINAFAEGLKNLTKTQFTLCNYEEHTLSTGSGAEAVAYIALANKDNQEVYGAGIDSNITKASIKALLSAFNRL